MASKAKNQVSNVEVVDQADQLSVFETEKDQVLTEIFNNDPFNLLDVSDVSENENQESETITMNEVKKLSDLNVGDQIMLVHTLRGKVTKELKEISEKTKSVIKVGSLRFNPDTGYGIAQSSQGKKISVPTNDDLVLLNEADQRASAFQDARFKLVELQAILNDSKADSGKLHQFMVGLDQLVSSTL